MTTEEINGILIKYNKLILKNINKVNINKHFLSKICVELEDIVQEVRIKLFFLLRDVYDSRFDIENFVAYQSAWNAKKIYNNLYRSSNCFYGTSRVQGTRGNRNSGQSFVDANKERVDKYLVDCVSNKNGGQNIGKKKRQPMPKSLINMEFEQAGNKIDYDYLVNEVINRLSVDYDKANYYKDNEYEKLKDIYIDIFIMLINEEIYLHFNESEDNSVYYALAKKFDYTYPGIMTIVNKIKVIVNEVVKEYNK
jgi:hypothetical protein